MLWALKNDRHFDIEVWLCLNLIKPDFQIRYSNKLVLFMEF